MSTPKHAPGAPRTPFAVLLGGLIVASLCALLALNTASAANEVRRHDLAVKDAAISDSLVQLNNDVNESAAPQNLAAAAAALGMVPANNPAFLVIGADGKVSLMGSPVAVKPPALPIAAALSPSKATPSSTPSSTPTGGAASSGSSKSTSKTPSTTPTGAHPSTGSSTPKGSSKPTPTPTATPTPTPTPTPNTTLPGGPR